MAGFSLSIKQTKGKSSPEWPIYADRFGEFPSRSGKQLLKEDFLWLGPGGIVGFTGRYQGCAVKNGGSYELTAIYCPCDLNTGLAQSAAKQEGTELITKSIQSRPWTFTLRPKQQLQNP